MFDVEFFIFDLDFGGNINVVKDYGFVIGWRDYNVWVVWCRNWFGIRFESVVEKFVEVFELVQRK